MHLDTRVQELPTVKKILAARLKTLGIETVKDLIFYFPFRYEDYARIVSIKELRVGETVSVRGTVDLIAQRRSWKRKGMITEILLNDATGRLKIICFNQPYLSKILTQGQEVVVAGTVREGRTGVQFTNPTIEKAQGELTHTARLVPIYPNTAGVTTRNLRFLIKKALVCVEEMRDWLPADILRAYKVPPLQKSLIAIHFPDTPAHFERARYRFAFEELFLIQMRSELRRRAKSQNHAPVIPFDQKTIKDFVAHLPFELTKDQRVATWDIVRDMARAAPMNRLLQGDVGSGKTVVGALACLDAAVNGFQAAWLAPTEILARQHFETLSELYRAVPGMTVALLTASAHAYYQTGERIGDQKVKKKDILLRIEAGEARVVAGTHALLQASIKFNNLALLIVDEQHRFGVRQRHALEKQARSRGAVPHFLSMTATPIPRSLALTVYGDLAISSIKTLPTGRKPIMSRLVPPGKREAAYQFIREHIRTGRQAYIVCPLIEPGLGEQTAAFGYNERKAVLEEFKRLHEQVFPELRMAMLHGKLKSVEKERIRREFSEGRYDILVSTTVVEVGIDVPNASIMMIEGAERFGLAQLHQLRGRVGRGSHQSFCFLFADEVSEKARERLEFFVRITDGFKLAEQDLAWRGPGEVYGTMQSGFPELKFASFSDTRLIVDARAAAEEFLKNTPDLRAYPEFRARIADAEETHLE
ncbi:MAG: ATP-dependent DNA helicase RecG [Candidatus Magasanikbacteria bacterium]|nr:ATP-dependent DNA helicase RecG [Candidatus Magasanikbacteria bacterium]